MRDGIDDECYQNTFVPIMSKVMECYQPSAVVLQCGADSLSGDRLGKFCDFFDKNSRIFNLCFRYQTLN